MKPKGLRLDRRLVIRVPTTTSDGRGGQSTTWADGQPVWASIQALSGRESLQAMAIQNQMAHLVTIRYTDEVVITYRLYWPAREKTLEIVGLRERDDLGRNRWMELECVEVDS